MHSSAGVPLRAYFPYLLSRQSKQYIAMARSLSTLFVATNRDPASMNIANHLLSHCSWESVFSEDNERILRSQSEERSFFMWIVNESLLSLNFVDSLFVSRFTSVVEPRVDTKVGPAISDVIFVSKHAAASGTVSLTVHPIGIPWLLEAGRYGGVPGRCSPPNHHIGGLYRSILKHVNVAGLEKTLQVTLEATHHGPQVEVPTCFVEIGSSEAEWGNETAGRIWAKCLGQYFSLPLIDSYGEEEAARATEETANKTFSNIEGGLVCLQIGGGHYIPKMNDMARYGTTVFVGHALATYTLQEAFETAATNSDGVPRWRTIIEEAIMSTRVSFPGSQIACYLDKRAFLSEQRTHIISVLEDNKVVWSFSAADIKKLLK